MRVVVATDHYPPHRSGHAVAVRWWADGLARAGHDVTVVTDAPPPANARHLTLRFPVLPGLPVGHPVAALRPVGRALDGLRRRPPDVLHLHGYGPLCLAVRRALPAVPTVVTLHQFPDGAGAPGVPGLRPLMRRLLAQAVRGAVVVVPSEVARAKLREGWGIDAHVLPTGVAPAFIEAAATPRPVAADGAPRLLYVGRRSADKNFDQLLRLARAHPEADWTVVGHGPMAVAPETRAIAAANPAEVAAHLREADALLAPSLNETQGLAALEAITVGTAVALPRGSAQAELIDEGRSGVAFARDDDADAWRALTAAAALTRSGGVRPALRLEPARLVSAMTALYREAAAG